MSETKSDRGISTWDLIYAINMAIACLVSYTIITSVLSHIVGRADTLLGGMWAVVATVFVFRDSRSEALAAGLARMIATCVSFALCLIYLLLFPYTPVGLVCLLALGTLIIIALGRRGDVVTTGITTTVVMVVAAMSSNDAWQQPLLRFIDTLVGVSVGVLFKWLASYMFSGLERPRTP